MKKIRYTKFKYVDEIIAQLAEKTEIRRAITRSNLCKFWEKVVGNKFASGSKPYGMRKGNIMVVACKTPVVAQELLLRKTQFLVKFKPYAQSLGLEVVDLVFDTKKWIDEEEK